MVVGLPRSGTTHLVNLLAADGRFRSLPLWESIEPVPDPAEPLGAGGADEVGTLERIYEAAGLPMTAEARAGVTARLAGRLASEESRRLAYDLRGDFGVTPEEVRAPFGFYLDAIAVHIEVD